MKEQAVLKGELTNLGQWSGTQEFKRQMEVRF